MEASHYGCCTDPIEPTGNPIVYYRLRRFDGTKSAKYVAIGQLPQPIGNNDYWLYDPVSDGCYFVRPSDPTSTKPQTILQGFQEIGVSSNPLYSTLCLGSPPTEPGPIILEKDEGMLPFTVFVDAIAPGSPDLFNYEFLWNFGDTGSLYNTVRGWTASHIYTTAGTKTITLTIRHPDGSTSVSTTTITVLADTRTPIYVGDDATANPANDGSTTLLATTLDKGLALFNNSTNKKLLLLQGKTYDRAGKTQLPLKVINGLIASWNNGGSTNKPIVKQSSKGRTALFTFADSTNTCTIQDLKFDGVAPLNATDGEVDIPDAVQPGSSSHVTVWNCDIANVGHFVYMNQDPTFVHIQGCTTLNDTAIRGYGVWCQGDHCTILGNTIQNSTRQHCIRATSFRKLFIAENVLTNLDRTGTDPKDIADGVITIQKGTYFYVDHNTITGGTMKIGPLGGSGGFSDPDYRASRSKYGVIERNTMSGTLLSVLHGAEDVVIRNNRISCTNSYRPEMFGLNSGYGRTTTRVRWYYNTIVQTSASFEAFYVLSPGGYRNEFFGNLLHTPNLPSTERVVRVIGTLLDSFSVIGKNVYYDIPGSVEFQVNNTPTTITTWNSTPLQDSGSVNDDLIFAIVFTGGHPTDGTGASEHGVPVLGVISDITGNVRPGGGIWCTGCEEP